MHFDGGQLAGNDEEPFEPDTLGSWKLQFELTEHMKCWVKRDWDIKGLPVQL